MGERERKYSTVKIILGELALVDLLKSVHVMCVMVTLRVLLVRRSLGAGLSLLAGGVDA